MPLSRLAAMHAAEIAQHDWSDAPFRADRAGHRRDSDGRSASTEALSPEQAEIVKLNAVWVTGQVLAYLDPNFDINEFGEAAGVARRFLYNNDGRRSLIMWYGLRHNGALPNRYHRPGTYEFDPE